MNVRSAQVSNQDALAGTPRLIQLVSALDGRINRAWYWLYLALATPALALLREAFSGAAGLADNAADLATLLVAVFAESLVAAAVLVISLAGASLTVRRLHDREKSGSWIVHFLLAPILLFWLGQLFLDAHLARVHSLPFLLQFVALFVVAWSFVELCCRRGTAGSNLFGPDPLQSKIDPPMAGDKSQVG
jgi:uncharacterized membrane protein YhaH (DUF805 family)